MSSVLIIEDDAAIRQGLSGFLAEAGHSVESLASGMDGVQAAAEGDFDVVVLDLGLPDIDGVQVLKMIRAVSAVPTRPVEPERRRQNASAPLSQALNVRKACARKRPTPCPVSRRPGSGPCRCPTRPRRR